MDAEAIAKLLEAARTGTPTIIKQEGLEPLVILPREFQVSSLAGLMTSPARVVAVLDAQNVESFMDYVRRFKNEHTVITADEVEGVFTAVVDYHEAAGTAHHGSHKAVFRCPFTPEWLAWKGADGQAMNQEAFATFIEDHYTDIIEPDHATMIEVSRGLQVSRSVQFGQATRLSDGQVQFNYTENLEGSVGRSGSMKVPEEFKLGLAIIRGGDKFEIRARLRYRLNGPSLSMWYQLWRADRVRDAAVADITAKVRTGLEGVPVYVGKSGAVPDPQPSRR